MTATIVLFPDVKRRVSPGFDLDGLKKAIAFGFLDAEFTMAKPAVDPRHRKRRKVKFTAGQVVAIVDGDRDQAHAALQGVAA